MRANENGQAVGAAHGRKVKAQGKDSTDFKIRQAKPGWLSKFLVRCEANRTEIVETVRLSFPNFDKALLSKCEHPEKYGVQLTPKVRKLLQERFGGNQDGTDT